MEATEEGQNRNKFRSFWPVSRPDARHPFSDPAKMVYDTSASSREKVGNDTPP